MIRGTTPTHTFTLPFSTELVSCLKITYKQDDTEILVKRTEDCELEGNNIIIKLTQEETFLFDCKKIVRIQMRVLDSSQTAIASKIILASVDECLDNEVLV